MVDACHIQQGPRSGLVSGMGPFLSTFAQKRDSIRTFCLAGGRDTRRIFGNFPVLKHKKAPEMTYIMVTSGANLRFPITRGG